jgi:PTH1 family peptidyl-tRNA hydrolase
MKLIVGLGNPGRQYERTRHNLGFMVADLLASRWSVLLSMKDSGAFGRGSMAGQPAALLKPMTYMNRSGQAVLEVVQFYKLPLSDLLVISDDLDLAVGRVRMRASGSAGGQKGLGDVIQRLGSDEVARIRIGIGRPAGSDAVDYVLSPFRPEEREPIEIALLRAAEAAECWITDGPAAAMNRYNRNADTKSEPE